MKIKEIVAAIKLASETLDKETSKISLKDLVDFGVSERQVRNNGGLATIRGTYFPNSEKNLAVVADLKQQKNYLNTLEKNAGQALLTQERQIELLKKIINPVKMPKAMKTSIKKGKLDRDVVAMLTDTHFGLNVNPEEVNGVNAYNWQIAGRRVAFFAKQIAEYKIEKRKEVGTLHLILNGDHLQGLIHGLADRTHELLGMQQNGAMHIFTYFISHLSQFYNKVEIYCNVGNHDENITRREGGRITSHAMKDSFLTPVYYGLSLAFKNVKNVNFNMSSGLLIDIMLPGGRAVAFHGHTIFSKQLGYTGSSINVKSLSDAINRWNSGEVDQGRKKATLVIFGHTHTHAEFTTFDGVRVLVSPCLSGIDNYAYGLGINHNFVAQPIFESTKNHIFGDSRMVDVSMADKDASLDKIVPTFTSELKYKK